MIRRNPRARGFSLVELLVVMAIVVVLAAISAPAVSGLVRANDINRAVSEVSLTLEMARVHAMANNTYVRVGFAETGSAGDQKTVIATMRSADGTSANSASSASDWPFLGRPVVLERIVMNDGLNASTPETASDHLPSQSDFGAASRTIPGLGDPVSFTHFIQFSPSGESRVTTNEPARFIKLGFEPVDNADSNPFVIRLSGTNGRVAALRQENGLY